MNRIGIYEKKPIAPGVFGKLLACEGFARPTFFKPFTVYQAYSLMHTGILKNNAGRSIGGRVVEYQYLVVIVLLPAQAIEASTYIVFFVTGWYQN
jgi:hypothetical protein